MAQAPILAILDFFEPFELETDAFNHTIGAVLMQNNHPIIFFQ